MWRDTGEDSHPNPKTGVCNMVPLTALRRDRLCRHLDSRPLAPEQWDKKFLFKPSSRQGPVKAAPGNKYMEQNTGKLYKPYDTCSSLRNPWWWAQGEFKELEWLFPAFCVLSPTTPRNVPCSLNHNEMPAAAQRYAVPYLKPSGPDVIWNSEIFRFYRNVMVHTAYLTEVYLITNAFIFLQLNMWLLTLMKVDSNSMYPYITSGQFVAKQVKKNLQVLKLRGPEDL